MNSNVFIKKACHTRWFRSLIMVEAAVCVICLQGAAYSGATAAVQAAYYVSPTGDDANTGTLAAPFRTITKARDMVQTINKNMTGDIIVYLRGGTYTIDSTISIGVPCSGTNGYTVKFMNSNGETPVISGGRAIEGWTLFDTAKNIYQATGVSFNFRQLYVNGVKAVRARTPNLQSGNNPNFWRTTGFDKNARNFQVESSKVSNWNNFTQVEMRLITQWGDNTMRLSSSSVAGSTAYLKIQSPEQDIIFQRPYPWLAGAQPYFFENAYEFLDTAGEWYLNQSTNTLYYKPRPGETMATATVIAPKVDTLLSIKGASTTNQAHNIAFSGIYFLYANYVRPSNSGFLDGQTGQYNLSATPDNKQFVARPGAGVYVACANHIRFERNIFAHMGATGLDFNYGTHDDLIIGNVFTDIAGSGVSIAKFTQDTATEYHVAYNPSDTNERCVHDTIRNNYIYKVTTEFYGACGIACGYPRMVNIVHNEVCYTSYTGISVGYGWTSNVNAMSNNHIDSNNIHHIMQLLCDGGTIYTLSNQEPNSTINYNYCHDFSLSQWAQYGMWGIYPDEQTSGYTITGNVFVNAANSEVNPYIKTITVSNNNGMSPTTIANAGIEAAYRDIKNFNLVPTCPVAISAPGPTQKTAPIPLQPKIAVTAQRISIDAMGSTISRIEIARLDGRLISAVVIRGSHAVSRPLTPGVYLVKIQAGERTFSSKIAVSR